MLTVGEQLYVALYKLKNAYETKIVSQAINELKSLWTPPV